MDMHRKDDDVFGAKLQITNNLFSQTTDACY